MRSHLMYLKYTIKPIEISSAMMISISTSLLPMTLRYIWFMIFLLWLMCSSISINCKRERERET